jgi:hypothetical protein
MLFAVFSFSGMILHLIPGQFGNPEKELKDAVPAPFFTHYG